MQNESRPTMEMRVTSSNESMLFLVFFFVLQACFSVLGGIFC